MSTQKYPVVMIGGPPDSGKSVLVSQLTMALRDLRRAHYVLRANPDGEGDWYNAIDEQNARALRHSGKYTPYFVAKLEQYLANPVFPLLVDVGGRPTTEQAAIFRHCSHALLLIGYPGDVKRSKDGRFTFDERYESAKQHWLDILQAQRIPLSVELESRLKGDEVVVATKPVLCGTIVGLERHQKKRIDSQVLPRIVNHLAQVFVTSNADMSRSKLAELPSSVEGVDLEQLLPTLSPQASQENFWTPADLNHLRQALADDRAIGIYGRAPVWVYGTIADHVRHRDLLFFDTRLGWISIPRLTQLPHESINSAEVQTGWSTEVVTYNDYDVLTLKTESQYLDINDTQFLPVPEIAGRRPLVISGKLPNWMWMSLVRGLQQRHPYLAIYQPQLKGAVIVATQDINRWPIGMVVSYTQPDKT